MNLGTRSPNDIRSVHFNQDVSCIAVAYGSGYCIFTLDPFVAVLKINNGGSIGIASLLYSTSLVALTGSGELPSHSTRRLQLVNTKRLSTICELTFPTSILAIRMNRRRLTVVLEEQLYIYDITKMELKNVVETVPNPQALIAMSYSEENSYIAYPARSPLPPGTMDTNPADDDGSHGGGGGGSGGGGSVAIFDAINCVPISIISAHKASLSAIALSSDGTLLATASEKGTIIRVFGVPNGERKFAFRRGTYSTKIHSMAFSHDNSLLAVTSNTETVHIFKLSPKNNSTNNTSSRVPSSASSLQSDSISSSSGGGSGGIFKRTSWKNITNSKLVSKAATYLPGTIAEMWEPERHFASLRLPSSGFKNLVGISSNPSNGKPHQIYVVTSDGYLYVYGIDLEKGESGTLLKQHSLFGALDDVPPHTAAAQ